MLSATLVGYVFQAVETRTHNDKTFHAMKLKLSQNKNSYIYVDCFVNDGIWNMRVRSKKTPQFWSSVIYLYPLTPTNKANRAQRCIAK